MRRPSVFKDIADKFAHDVANGLGLFRLFMKQGDHFGNESRQFIRGLDLGDGDEAPFGGMLVNGYIAWDVQHLEQSHTDKIMAGSSFKLLDDDVLRLYRQSQRSYHRQDDRV